MPSKKKGINFQKTLVNISKTLGSLVIIGVIILLIPLSLPRLFGFETYNVISGSMEPEIPVGSLVLVKYKDPAQIKEGEIVTYYSSGIPVTHRVTYNNSFEGYVTTKGDANEGEDLADVNYNELIGVVEYHYPLLGMLGEYLSSFSGKLLVVELITCAFLLHIVADKIKL